MKHLPLYSFMLLLGVCMVFGCRKDMNTISEQEKQELLKSKVKLDSAGNPIDNLRDSIPHHPDTIPHHPHDTIPHYPDSTRRR